jgi:hypothetical protein
MITGHKGCSFFIEVQWHSQSIRMIAQVASNSKVATHDEGISQKAMTTQVEHIEERINKERNRVSRIGVHN